MATAFDMPARQSFVTEMVGPDRVANAVGLNSASFNTARVLGPAVAGGLIAVVGIAPAFFLNAVSYLAMIGGLLAMDPDRLYRRAAVERGRGQIRAGVRYVWATPVLRSTILLVAVVGMLGLNYRVALPLLARFAFDGGPGTYGILAAIMAAGSVAGALTVARRGRPTRALLVGSVAAFGLLSFAAAARPDHRGRGGVPVPDRRGQPRLRGHGQLDRPARLRPGDARPRDEPVRPGPARLEPAQRPAQRLDGRPVRPPLDPAPVRRLLRPRGHRGRPDRPRPGEHRRPPFPATPNRPPSRTTAGRTTAPAVRSELLELGQGLGMAASTSEATVAVEVAGEAVGPAATGPAGAGRQQPRQEPADQEAADTRSRGTGTSLTVGRSGRSAWARPARYRVRYQSRPATKAT